MTPQKLGQKPVNLETAAEYLGVTTHTLRRRLKSWGISFSQLKDDTRRDVALALLENNKLTIQDIAARVGFSDSSTFTRAFKDWTHVAPNTYRKNLSKSAH